MGFFSEAVREGTRWARESASIFTGLTLCRPSHFHFNLTKRCNSRCRICAAWEKDTGENELSTSQWLDVITQAGKWTPRPNIGIMGGEALVRDDAIEIIRAACEKTSGVVTLITNGLSLKRDAEKIANLGLAEIAVSVDALEPEKYEKLRGVDALSGVLEGIDLLKNAIRKSESKTRVSIAAVLSGPTLDEMEKLLDYVSEKNIKGLTVQPLSRYRCSSSKDFFGTDFWIRDFEKLDRVIEKLISRKNSGAPLDNSVENLRYFKTYFRDPSFGYGTVKRCHVAYTSFIVEPDGDVRLCFLCGTVGNVKTAGLKEIYNSPEAEKRRLESLRCKVNCGFYACNYRDPVLKRAARFIKRRIKKT